jgi:hypothetical protein
LPWHSAVVGRVEALGTAGQLPSAIALTSADGWGATELLNGICNLLLDQPPETDASQLAHPDLRWIVPDGAMIKVDQIRRVNEFAVQTPQIAPRKVVAIADAHLLNVNAANALLKTLEEPPPNTHILLETTRWGRLLPTIRSRCQRFQHDQSSELARRWLTEQGVELSEREFAELGYAPVRAAMPASMNFSSWLAKIEGADLATLIDEIGDVDVVAWLARWYRAILWRLAHDEAASTRSMHAFADELISIRRQIETSNSANTRLLLERLIVLWRKLAHS